MLENIISYSFFTRDIIWATQIFLIIFSALIFSFFIDRFGAKYEKKLSNNNKVWDDLLIKSARKPVKFLIWLFGITLAAKITSTYINANLFDAIYLLKDFGVILSIAWFSWSFVKGYEIHLTTNVSKIDTTTVIAITKLIKAAIVITVILMILQTFGMNIGGILAFGGVSGIVIGFAAKDLLANFFGAMMIYLDRPFSVGDWIKSPDREIEGTVEYIGWRLTYIRTFDSRILYVPNSVFSTISIENPSRMSNRRISETIGVRYLDVKKVGKIIDEVKEMLVNHPEIEQNKTLMVNLNKFNDYSVDFFIYCFTKTKEWVKYHQVKQEILLKISDIINENKAEIAFPTSIVNFEEPLKIAK